jgi:phosphoribosylanthranilate isomerase
MRAANPAQAVRDFIGKPEPLPSRTVFTKICGITNVEDARAALEAGADMLGFNFYRRSQRFIEPNAARIIIETVRSKTSAHAPVKCVGVFVNESIKEVIRIATRTRLDGIQLHGDEDVEFCAELKNGTFKPFVIKVFRTGQNVDLARLEQYAVDAFMVDAYDPKLRGGTGRAADWTLAREAAKQLPRVFLAGGLSPENVGDAIAAVRPYAVDACSSLEVSPGKKDHARMREFVAAVRASKLQPEEEMAK